MDPCTQPVTLQVTHDGVFAALPPFFWRNCKSGVVCGRLQAIVQQTLCNPCIPVNFFLNCGPDLSLACMPRLLCHTVSI